MSRTAEEILTRLVRRLANLGWHLPGQRDHTPAAARRDGWRMRALPLESGEQLLLAARTEALPPVGDSFKRYEDLAPMHRRLRSQLADAPPGLAVLATASGAQLVDFRHEEVLLEATGEPEVAERLLPMLAPQGHRGGWLAGMPRKSPRARARELCDWTNLWSARFGGTLELPPAVVAIFFDALLLARLAEVLGARCASRRFIDFADGPSPAAPRFVESTFVAMQEKRNILQEAVQARQLAAIARHAHDRGILVPCLSSFALLSRSKFTAEMFAEAFADEELRNLSWRASILAEESPTAGIPLSEWWYASTCGHDIDRLGVSMLLRRFDELVGALQGDLLDQRSRTERGERPGIQLDMIEAADDPARPADAVGHVLRRVLVAQSAEPARVRVARTALVARALEWRARLDQLALPLPRARVELARQTRTLPRAVVDAGSGLN